MEMFWGVIICDLTFIICAYMINEKNADMLLAGYNTMSKKEKEHISGKWITNTRSDNESAKVEEGCTTISQCPNRNIGY